MNYAMYNVIIWKIFQINQQVVSISSHNSWRNTIGLFGIRQLNSYLLRGYHTTGYLVGLYLYNNKFKRDTVYSYLLQNLSAATIHITGRSDRIIISIYDFYLLSLLLSSLPVSIESFVGPVNRQYRSSGVSFSHPTVSLEHDNFGPNLVVDLRPLIQYFLNVIL